jgi:hypothetical protein
MESSRITTLFAELPPSRRGPSAFLVSMVLHVLVMGLLYLNLRHAIKVEDEAVAQRFTVRLLNLRRPEHHMRRPAERSIAQAARAAAGEVVSGGHASAPAPPQQLAQMVPAPQTLLQPDLPANLLLPQETPVPLILMWSPESSTVKKIVPPPPQEHAAANVRSDIKPPNHELALADLKISRSAFVTDAPLPLPSTTSPVVLRGPDPVKLVPEKTPKSAGPPAPARVLSLSDLHLEQGTIALPPVNEIAASGPSETITPARVNSSHDGEGNPASKQNGSGVGEIPGDQRGKGAGPDGVAAQQGAKDGPDTGAAASQAANADSGSEPSVTRIVLPKDGQFGVVVVGSSMAEQYPEAVGLWGSRLAYTVYLHVGLSKNWILQYCLPPGAVAANNGAATRLEAPWPYLMERPELSSADLNADAIMVHGFVNASGRFEKLAIVFPAGFAQTKFVLSALDRWQFRAAMQNGLMTTVEVLLIIPIDQ